MKIVFVGGGTGGHIMPLIAIARELKHKDKSLELHYLGPNDALLLPLLKKEKIQTHSILAGKLRRYFSLHNILDILFKIPAGFLQSLLVLLLIRPNLVLSKGGTGAFVACYAAKLLRIPVFIHESDTVPGLSNKKSLKFATRIFTAFEKTEYVDPKKTTVVGNPIRKELLQGNAKEAAKTFRLAGGKPVILFWGGSQGADFMNMFLVPLLNEVLKKYEVIHVAGPKNFMKVALESKLIVDKNLEKYYHVQGTLTEEKVAHALKAADIIVSRTGSSGIFEIAAAGKPSILIPLPSAAGNHQLKNAESYAQTGAGIIIEQGMLSPKFFMEELHKLTLLPQKKKMQKAALEFAKPEAAATIAKEIIEFLKTKQQEN